MLVAHRFMRSRSRLGAMVEGDGCHRIAAEHRKTLVGRKLKAKSPNGRFKAGAQAIVKCGGVLSRIEVHGKNMFYFFGQGSKVVVMHVHFGMAGASKRGCLPCCEEPLRFIRVRSRR